VFVSLKPITLCVPSQKGLFFEAPQRHSATARTFAQASPEARRRFGTGLTSMSVNR